jgi:hypothetical protein
MFLMLYWVYIHTGQAEKLAVTTVGIEPATFGGYLWYFGTKSSIFDTTNQCVLWSWSNFSAYPVWIYTQSNIKNTMISIFKKTLNHLKTKDMT